MTTPSITIQSITGVDVELRIAGAGSRSYAFIIDWHVRLLLAFAWWIAGSYAAAAGNIFDVFRGEAGFGESYRWVVVMPALAIYFLYHPVLELAMRGKTPGKRMAGVRIVTRTGDIPGPGALLLRNVFRIVDSLPVMYLVGLVAVMFTEANVRVGDMAAGTLLVMDNTTNEKTFGRVSSAMAGHRLDPQSFDLVQELLDRWQVLDDATRATIARSLLAKLDKTIVERKRTHTAAEALQAVETYRSLGRDLSIARRVLSTSRMTRALEERYLRLHAIIHRKPHDLRARLRTLFRDEIPAVVTGLRPYVLWVTLLFAISTACGWWLVNSYPELISLIASEEMINGVEKGHLWTEGLFGVVPPALLSVSILTNNIMVSLGAFCLGILFGLGTLYMMGFNGLMLGAMFAFTRQHGLDGELLKFIAAHGPVELSVICLAGAAGMMVGESLIRPTHPTRRESFQHATGKASKLLLLCALLLIGCGFIEGHLSPDPGFPLLNRAVVGVGYWLIMLTALTGRLFGKRSTASLSK